MDSGCFAQCTERTLLNVWVRSCKLANLKRQPSYGKGIVKFISYKQNVFKSTAKTLFRKLNNVFRSHNCM